MQDRPPRATTSCRTGPTGGRWRHADSLDLTVVGDRLWSSHPGQAYFQPADFVLLPYKAISQSGVLLSALSQARVVAASAIGDMTALVNATQEGYCIPPEDPPALAIALRAILARNPADLRTAGTAARDRLSDTFGWTRIAESTITQYQRCLRPRSARVALQLPGRQPAS